MRQFIEYTLTLQSDGVIEAIANSIRSRSGQLNEQSIELAKDYANAVNGGVGNSDLLRNLGKHLYKALFTELIDGHFYEQAWRRMKEDSSQQTFIRLRLVFQRKVSSEILSLPWEFLCFDGNFLGTDPKVAFSYRYDDWLTNHSESYLCEDLPLRVLFVHVHPEGYDVSFRTVRRNIQELERASVKFEFDELENPSLEELREKLQSYRPHVLHFLVHGQFKELEGALALSDKDGQVFWYRGQSFSSLFRVWQPQLMVLESCEGGRLSDLKSFSGNAAELVRQHIPAIVAMRYPFTQRSGWVFARTFYRSLASGNPIDVAVQEGRCSLAFAEGQSAAHASRDFAAPVLWMRVNHGRLFPVVEEQKAGTSEDTNANPKLKQVSKPTFQLPENPSITAVEASSAENAQANLTRPHDISDPVPQPVPPAPVPPLWRSFRAAIAASIVVTSLVMVVRSLGLLQAWELNALDQLMRWRPSEEPDPRLLIVEVTDEDIQTLGELPLTDQTVLKLLQKLEQYQPRVIGLDIFRDKPQPKGGSYADLLRYLQKQERIIVPCRVEYNAAEGATPPSGIPPERLGFTNVVLDDDEIIRRHLLTMDLDPEFPCKTTQSLSFGLVHRFLVVAREIEPEVTEQEYIQFDSTVLKPLPQELPASGYQTRNTEWGGYQMLLNYRASDPIARTVSLTKVLEGQVEPDWIKNKIVLIGYTAQKAGDLHLTPYSAGHSPKQRMPGVLIQAHMVSQILSAVLDGRPLLQVEVPWGETFWIWFWSFVGGGLVPLFRSPLRIGLSELTAIFTLCVLCYAFLLCGLWIPLIPSLLVLVATGGVLLNLHHILKVATFFNMWIRNRG